MEWFAKSLKNFCPRTLGIAAIMVSVFLLSLSDALVKLSGDRFGLAQMVILRSLIAGCLIAAGISMTIGSSALRTKRSLWVWSRSLSLTAMWVCYYAALPSMSFAMAAACYYTAPAWMALMARCLNGTAIGVYGWTAIALSMLGVVLVVDPGAGQLTFFVLLPLSAAMFYALAGTIT